MNRQEYSRTDPKRRQVVNHKKKQFVNSVFDHHEYKHRLNFYTIPPTADITLEEFELWAIDRLKGTTHNSTSPSTPLTPPSQSWPNSNPATSATAPPKKPNPTCALSLKSTCHCPKTPHERRSNKSAKKTTTHTLSSVWPFPLPRTYGVASPVSKLPSSACASSPTTHAIDMLSSSPSPSTGRASHRRRGPNSARS